MDGPEIRLITLAIVLLVSNVIDDLRKEERTPEEGFHLLPVNIRDDIENGTIEKQSIGDHLTFYDLGVVLETQSGVFYCFRKRPQNRLFC